MQEAGARSGGPPDGHGKAGTRAPKPRAKEAPAGPRSFRATSDERRVSSDECRAKRLPRSVRRLYNSHSPARPLLPFLLTADCLLSLSPRRPAPVRSGPCALAHGHFSLLTYHRRVTAVPRLTRLSGAHRMARKGLRYGATVARLTLDQVILVRIQVPQPLFHMPPSSSPVQDIGLSSRKQGFKSPWGYQTTTRASASVEARVAYDMVRFPAD